MEGECQPPPAFNSNFFENDRMNDHDHMSNMQHNDNMNQALIEPVNQNQQQGESVPVEHNQCMCCS